MATTSGVLTNKVVSSVSSPAVNYSAAYTATRVSGTTAAVSVKLDFSAWLNSSQSALGTGIKLTVFVRINGGLWKSAVIKENSVSWSGTTTHSASLTLSANSAVNTAKIEFYISRTGSNYSGTAGNLGSTASPKRYTVTLPAYSSGNTGGGGDTPSTPSTSDTPADTDKHVYVNVGGVWKRAAPYVNVSGTWKKAVPHIRVNGVWKPI